MRGLKAFVQIAAVGVSLARALPAQCPDGVSAMTSCRAERPVRAIDPDAIAIVPFRTSGADPSLAYLRDALVDFLSAELAGDPGPRAIEPGETLRAWKHARLGVEPATEAAAARVARELGAGQVAFGSVAGTPSRLTVFVSIINTRDGKARGRPIQVSGSADSLAVLVSDLSSNILGRSSGELRMTGSLPERTNHEALRAFIAARRAYREGIRFESIKLFEQVLEMDPSFVLAAYWLIVMREMESIGANRVRAAVDSIAWHHRDRLSRDERALIEAVLGPGGSSATRSRAATRAAMQEIAERRNTPEAWQILGESYFHYGALIGVDDWRARARSAFEHAFAGDSSFGIGHMAELTYLDNDVRAHAIWMARGARRGGPDDSPVWDRYVHAIMTGDRTAARAAGERYARARDLVRVVFASTFMPASELEANVNRIERTLGCCGYSAEDSAARSRSLGLLKLSLTANGGRAGRNAARAAFFPNDTLLQLLDALRSADEDSADVERLAHALRDDPTAGGRERWVMTCEVALARLRRGDTTGATAAATSLQQNRSNEAKVCGALVDHIGASFHPGGASRLAVADSMMRAKIWHTPSNNANPHWNYDLAVAFARQGDWRAAAAAARRRLLGRRIRLTPALRDEGRWAAQAGDTVHAIAAFRWYLKLRDNPEPALIAERDSVRVQLAALEAKRNSGSGKR